MFSLRCTVRNCDQLLSSSGNSLRCSKGHHFDRARQGYWNLLQPQDSKSRNPGDCDVAVLARSRCLERGHMIGLADTIRDWLTSNSSPSRDPDVPRTLELGCGEGTLSAALFAAEASGYCGIDLSKRAIKLAAHKMPNATWLLANADRFLPADDDSVDRVVSLFGRRPASEIARVLRSGGLLIVAIPAADDLTELRELIQLSAQQRYRADAIIAEMDDAGLTLKAKCDWQHRVTLDENAISDALAMTYRGARQSQQSRADGVGTMTVTLAADLLFFEKAIST